MELVLVEVDRDDDGVEEDVNDDMQYGSVESENIRRYSLDSLRKVKNIFKYVETLETFPKHRFHFGRGQLPEYPRCSSLVPIRHITPTQYSSPPKKYFS